MSSPKARIAVVGSRFGSAAELLSALTSADLPIDLPLVVGPSAEVGTEVYVGERTFVVHPMPDEDWSGFDLAILCDPAPDLIRLSRMIREAGCTVLDLTGAFLDYREVIPLVGGVNEGALPEALKTSLLVAAPPLAVLICSVLKPLLVRAELKRVSSLALVAASHAGKDGMETLSRQTLNLYRSGRVHDGDDETNEQGVDENTYDTEIPFAQGLAFNILPSLGSIHGEGVTLEEGRLARSVQAVLGLPNLPVGATIVAVPVFAAHAVHLGIELNPALSVEDVHHLFESAEGLVPEAPMSPGLTPFHVAGTDAIAVGRVRVDSAHPGALLVWAVADNLGRCVARNAVDILRAWLACARVDGGADKRRLE